METLTKTRHAPAYVARLNRQDLTEQAVNADRHLEDCDLCARYCHVNRKRTIKGAVCRTGANAVIHSSGPHHGEESCLSGTRGSGTIFFSWCNLRCIYCQNWDISWKGHGMETSNEDLADMMLRMQSMGCHNINFVSPSHVVAQIIAAVAIAKDKGLHLPLVYNTGGYDSPEALSLLDGIIDIYMPDMKYGDSDLAKRYSHVKNYVAINRAAVKEMHRQVGDLVTDEGGIAERGLLVRHLVLPNGIAGTEDVMQFIAREISTDTYVNIMGQYRPCYRAGEVPELNRPVSSEEYAEALAAARAEGLQRCEHYPETSWLARWEQ